MTYAKKWSKRYSKKNRRKNKQELEEHIEEMKLDVIEPLLSPSDIEEQEYLQEQLDWYLQLELADTFKRYEDDYYTYHTKDILDYPIDDSDYQE